MEKDKTIVRFLDRIKNLIDQHNIEIKDYWETDLCAIGIKKGEKLIYISTYNYVEAKIVKYDFDLELIDDSGSTKVDVLKEGRSVTEDDLIQEIKSFFEI